MTLRPRLLVGSLVVAAIASLAIGYAIAQSNNSSGGSGADVDPTLNDPGEAIPDPPSIETNAVVTGTPLPDVSVVNLDGAHGSDIAEIALTRGLSLLTTGTGQGADLQIAAIRPDATGQEVRYLWQGRAFQTRLNLIGAFQAENVALAAGLAIAAGDAPEAVLATLPRLTGVRGRMQLAATRANGASVFVDYAHTPDAVATALTALRPHVMGRLVIAFGAGGDRDTSKRPLMGAAAAAHADVLFVTDDNPRGEDPAAIRAAILTACPEANEVGDRAEAILRAVDALQPGDALLIAGKGHETGQVINGDVFPFDDVEQASIAVAALDGVI